MSLHTIERELEDGRLVVLDVEPFPIMRQWYIVHRAGKRLSGVGLAFEEFVRAEASNYVRVDLQNFKPSDISSAGR